ncbi:MAG: HAD family hydrolase, partial [Actinomadura rubrobrunea]|nr:HAD family hydrolase [Actinomadura rubrobrunea]
ALTAPPDRRPTYLAPDLTGLLVPHPPAVRSADGFACAGWTARWTGDTVELTGGGDPYDGLRALAAAAWSAEHPVSPESVVGALKHLGLD